MSELIARLTVVTPPATLPVTTSLARKHTRIDTYDEDDLVDLYIATATSLAEKFLNRALITQTLEYTFGDTYPPNAWPLVPVNPVVFVLPLDLEWTYNHMLKRDIELPYSTVQAINNVAYNGWFDGDADSDDSPQTLTLGTDYWTDITVDPARIRLSTDVPWTNRATLSINYTAGYGDNSSDVPTSIIHAILLTTAWLWENRGDTGGSGMPEAAESLLWPYRLVTFA